MLKHRLNVFEQRLNTQKMRAQDFYVERALYKRREKSRSGLQSGFEKIKCYYR